MPTDSSDASLAELLNAALREHQQGRLTAAEAAYQQVLSRQPDHADALHLLGVLAHQRGDHRRAIELICFAIARSPQAAVFHANLAEAYRALRKFDEAIACCRRALELQPDFPQTANNLGLALLEAGRLEEARAELESLLLKNPEYAEAHNNLGNALRKQGRGDEAIAAFRRALALRSDLAEAHSNLGQLLLEKGQADQALAHCREAVRVAPRFAEALNNLGNALRKLGRLEEAKEHYGKAIRIQPELAMAYSNLGLALEEEGRLDEAIDLHRQALSREPHSARICANLARALVELGRLDEAGEQLQTALRLDPQCAEAHDGLGDLLRQRGPTARLAISDLALARFFEALRLNPDLTSARVNLGHCRNDRDQGDQAAACFREALRRDPLHAAAHAGLAATLAADLPEAEAESIQQLLERGFISDRKRAELHFALANVRDAQGQFALAEQHAREANAIRHRLLVQQGRRWDAAEHLRLVDRLIEVFDDGFFQRVAGWGLESDLPLFHVGLPRAGKTLAEGLLAAHPAVFAAGELGLGRQALEAFPEALGVDDAPLDCIARSSRDSVVQIARRRLDPLLALAPDAARVVDTMPHNYLYLGVIAALFPRARIVHCCRDPRDTAVACWFKNFKHLPWAFDLDDLAVRIGAYRRIMEHWRRVLPAAMLEIDYEELVADPRRVSRQLVEFAGLAWGPDCLRVRDHPLRRASAQSHDARPPFTTQFVGRWRHYLATLAPVLDELSSGS